VSLSYPFKAWPLCHVPLALTLKNSTWFSLTRQEDINLEIRKGKFRWIGRSHIKKRGRRNTKGCPTLQNPQGNRKRGKPENSWRRSVIKEVGRSWNELRFLAADRQKWKGLIDNLCS
jgi:hypothetical protein